MNLKLINKLFIKLKYKLLNYIEIIYAFLFSRVIFYKFNAFLYRLSLKGIGITLDTNMEKNGESRFLKKILNKIPEPIIFDIGANTGHYCETIIKHNSNSIVYAFEPHPISFIKLKNNDKLIDNVRLFNFGMSDKNSEAIIYDYAHKEGSPKASLYKDVIEVQYNSRAIGHKIKLTTIDDFVQEYVIKKIDLIKIDTEGHELAVLKGASESINNKIINTIQFEFNYTNIISRAFLNDFYGILNGFTLYRILRDGLIKLEFSAFNEILLYQNIVAIRN